MSMRQKFVLLEIVTACAMLAACGGGGGAPDASADAPVAGQDGVVSASTDAAAPTADAAAPGDAADSAAVTANAADAPQIDASDEAGATPPPDAEGGGSMEAVSQSYPQDQTAADAADAAALESPQTLSIDSNDAGYAKPKVAALDYSSDSSSTRQALLAKFRFVIFGARSGATASAFSAGIHSRNSSTRQAYYTIFTELPCSMSSSEFMYPMVQAANQTNYWLRKADGTRSQWSTKYNACDMNVTSWSRKDSSGYNWVQRKAKFDYEKSFSKLPYVSYVFSDNTFSKPRVDADWRRIGTNQHRTDSTIISAQRSGQVAYWNALKSRKSSLRIIGNADSDLSFSPYLDRLNGAFFEGAMGKSWSLESWAGWKSMMSMYYKFTANTASPNIAFLQAYGGSTDYRMMRYGLASAMMHNGYFVYLPSSGTLQPKWYDEYDARIGDPVQSPPTGPKQNGIWMRKYSNGLVLVNPSKTTTASIYVGSGYKRLKGTQDPGVNNGYVQSTVTLGPRQGLLMVKN